MLTIRFSPEEKETWKGRKRKISKQWKKYVEKKREYAIMMQKLREIQPEPPKERRKPRKRKSKTAKFIETPVGHYMYVYAPVEYFMLMEYAANTKRTDFTQPMITAEQIELIAIHTGNPAFKTTTFRKAIISYRMYGDKPPKKAHWTLRDAYNFAKFSSSIHKQLKECERLIS